MITLEIHTVYYHIQMLLFPIKEILTIVVTSEQTVYMLKVIYIVSAYVNIHVVHSNDIVCMERVQ